MSDPMTPGGRVPGPACARYTDLLPVLAQNGADAGLLAQARAHVAGCAYCSGRLAAYAALDGALARTYGSGTGHPAVDIAAIMRRTQMDERSATSDGANKPPHDRRTRHAHQPRRPSRRLADLAGIAAAVLIVLAIAGLILSHLGSVQQGTGPKRTPVPNIATATPTVTPTPTTAPSAARSFRSVHMVSPATGWALLSDGGLGRTTDGGVHWTDVTPPGAQMTDNNTALAAISDTEAWMADTQAPCARIWHTSDGGQSWTPSPVPHTRIQTAPSAGGKCGAPVFGDAQHGWLMESLGVAGGSEAVAIYRTTDGGATWSEISDAVSKDSGSGELPFSGDKSGVAFANANTGWVTGTSAAPGFWLYVTHDGGQTWSQQTPPMPPGVTAQTPIATNPPVFFSATSGVLPVMALPPQGTLADFYVTHDGGQTWTPTRTVPFAGIYAWSFIDASHWWAMAGNALFASSDAGQSWTTITPSGAFNNSVMTFDMVSSSTGYAVVLDSNTGTGSLIKTTDGGHTWATVAVTVG